MCVVDAPLYSSRGWVRASWATATEIVGIKQRKEISERSSRMLATSVLKGATHMVYTSGLGFSGFSYKVFH